ncbi:unnamed protein product [Arabidopsis thaliana]|uniref:ADP-ribosyl cyclase/cyclic ADP-ribose hydrolase n=1 Tax=Arabidopsis thaliana TaxID=3702 RepID=A0A5S9Y5S8_ARATH|nr:unnamed protein product [Arabidopsis thaliana]
MAIAEVIGFFTLVCVIWYWVYKKHKNLQLKICRSSIESSSSSSSLSSPPTLSSPIPRTWRHQVFPSFRGEDVRKGFLSHIQKEFKSKGIVPFIDDEMKRGESIGPGLFQAIRESKIAIVLLSKNYASSSWCLNELVEIMNCREEIGQTVMTVFYQVDPSDVRKQTGDFGKAFKKTCVGKTQEVKQRWSRALMDVANILGQDSRKWDKEADMIVKVAKDVSDVLSYTPSRDFDDYVGIRPHITRINSLLCLESSDVRMIGILGPPGIGKTTIARVLYDQISEKFQFSAFIENIRLSYWKGWHDEGNLDFPVEIMTGDRQRKLNLQRRLLSELFNQKDIQVRHLGAVQERLRDHKVLVILDGVDQLEQLTALAKETQWFGYGSRIIITTQDQRLLRAHEINHVYKVDLPATDEALQIFCLYAFGQKFPYDGFKKLAREFTALAGELPLGLRVLGSYLRGMSLEEWKNALPRLRTSLDGEIEKTLRFAYNVLSDKDKSLFLHIACLFNGCQVNHVKQWLANSSLDVNHGFEVLSNKSLISTDMGLVRMHSLLQQLGVDIVRKQSIGEPEKRQFLVDVNEISDVITDNTGTGTILGIMLHVSKIEDVLVIEETVFDRMTNLQFLILDECLRDKLNLPLGLNCLPRKIRLLRWDYCPLSIWPSKFSAKFLVELIMRANKFEKLWEGIQPLKNLKRMELGDARNLKEIPDLSNATNLESLLLSFCTSLLEIPSSIRGTTNLKELDLGGCASLVKLSSCICNATSLEELNLSACSNLVELPCALPGDSNMRSLSKLLLNGSSRLKTFPEISTNIQELNLSGTAIEEVPSSIRLWSRLDKLDMSRCKNLKMFPPVPDGISVLNLSETEIEDIPPWVENLSQLRHFVMIRCKKLDNISLSRISKMEGVHCLQITRGDEDVSELVYTSPVSLHFISNEFKTIPDCIKNLSQLHQLSFYRCHKLVSLPQLSDCLSSLDAENCVSLETIDGSFHNPDIRLNFLNCNNLNQEARELIQKSVCKHALLPSGEVPAYFIHRAIGDSVTIHLKERHLPLYLIFKASLVLFNDDEINYDYDDDDDDDYDEEVIVYGDYDSYPHSDDYTKQETMRLSCRVEGKQNGLTIQYGSSVHLLPTPHRYTEHVYIFEASFSLGECNSPEAESELVFDFKVHDYFWAIKECGLQLLELPHAHGDD